MNLGSLVLHIGRYEKAIQYFQRALVLGKEHQVSVGWGGGGVGVGEGGEGMELCEDR